MTTEIINQYVTEFMNQFTNGEEINAKWLSINNQKKIKKLFRHPKDPYKPKRGKSGFLFFCKEMRPKLIEENRNMSVKEIVSELGRMWRDLKTSGQTDKYENMSKEDRERYSNEMIFYKEKKRQNKSVVTTTAKTPKKCTPFYNFVQSKKSKLIAKDSSLTDVAVNDILKQKWDKLPVSKQEKYK